MYKKAYPTRRMGGPRADLPTPSWQAYPDLDQDTDQPAVCREKGKHLQQKASSSPSSRLHRHNGVLKKPETNKSTMFETSNFGIQGNLMSSSRNGSFLGVGSIGQGYSCCMLMKLIEYQDGQGETIPY
ncbi:predicted protein [Sclerotinia sclerotiorum 1980 UF-70]|uniref:Uncharacterized protein n=1 Tax=Sclerotinia sclerotiorum (strain ATCC 18683 / 1980 / Ss-1) TaxID=665079 RepID=A7EUR0_SCLS1|nr:predicted protein [Sclerotinia sclerotiorum 1980 UF-70]EDN93202.1 predicted protein [Sclerotinia sclerotiorum 1980 UF-70]